MTNPTKNPEFDSVTTDRLTHGHERVTTDATLDGKSHYTVDASSARTVTLPTITDEREINVKRDGANTVTIDTAGTETIEGASTLDLTQDGESVTVVFDPDNSNWEVF